MSMTRQLKRAFALVSLALPLWAEAVTAFDAAESVWPAGLEAEMNTLIAFRAPLELKAGERPVLKMVAWYSYRVTLNGAFVGFGPARGPKGFFRPDEWDLSKAAKPGRNELCVEVAGYNVPNFYLMEQPPFFKAEVVCGGKIRAATKRTGGAFAATRQPRVQKVPRYSFQRTFCEAYRLPAPAHPPALALAAAPEPTLIERRAPYPDFEVNPRMVPVSFANVRYDETASVHADRALTLPGASPIFKGFPLADLELNVAYLAQRLVSSDRRPATDFEKASASFALAAGASMVFDNGLNDTGFPGLRVEVKKPGRLVLQFDEVLAANGEARGIRRYKDCCNALVWDFTEAGVYEVDAFEPYTMRYVELDVVSGEMVVSAPRFRSYKNPTAKRARFRASDPALVAVFDAANETFRQNAVDVFMDCPSRERAGWNCDAYFTAPASTLLTGDFALERIFEENLALPPVFDDIAEGALPMCYPSDHRDRVHIPNWGMWFVLETEEYLRRTGDRATVDALRPRLEKFVDYLWKYRNADGLLERLPSWVFVEWSRANKLVQDVNYPSNMTWSDTLDAMDRLYGRPDLAAEAARVRAEVRRQSWTGAWFCDNAVRQKDGSLKLSGECTETCQYYAFFHRVATPETHPALWKTLLADFGPKRYDPSDRKKMLKHPEIWPSNAFIGNYLRLKLLERAGRGRQILDETKGYFTYMAERTGTLWENDTTSASCNHGFASYAAVLLVHSVLGVEVDHRTKTVTARPTDVDLAFCGVTLPVPGGEIVYDWTVKGGRREETFAAPPGWRLIQCHAKKPECSRPSFVMRFDDNKPVSQWREVAEIFETIGGRCSFAVNAATLDDEQWAALRDLAARGHEIMDHTAQHAVFKLLCATAAEADRHRSAEFFDHVEQDGRLVLCRPELDLGCAANVRVQATMTNGVLRSTDPAFLRAQGFSRKFHVPSVGRTYGFGKDCGYGLFKKGPEQRCSDFWGRWTTDSFGPCEIVILAEEAVQPSLDLLRAQAQASISLFVAHGLPPPKTWIRPGGWEGGVDWRRMKAVYGDAFGYAVADSTLAKDLPPKSPWCRRSDFAFFDSVPDVDKVYARVAAAVASGQSFAYISHQWTKDRAKFLEQCRAFAARLKAGGIRMTTYSED